MLKRKITMATSNSKQKRNKKQLLFDKVNSDDIDCEDISSN